MSIPPTANSYLVDIRSKPQDLSLSSTLHSVLLPFYDQFPPFWSLHPFIQPLLLPIMTVISLSFIVLGLTLNMSEVFKKQLTLIYPFPQNWHQ